MAPKDSKSIKQELRGDMKSRLLKLSSASKLDSSNNICTQIENWLGANPHCKTIATFSHLTSEPDLSSLLETLPHLTWVYPHSQPGGSMQFHHVKHHSELEPGLYGILQPKNTASTLIPPEEIDCFLCPAFAYSQDGSRLGKGGGYYDRILEHRNPSSTLIGVAFQQQLLETIPTEPHDIKVDLVITA